MFFTPETLGQFCPSYRRAILKFEKKYSSITGNDENAIKAKKKLILKFSENYLTPKEIWDEFFILHDKCPILIKWNVERDDVIVKSNTLHFYFNDDRNRFKDLKKRLIRYQSYPRLPIRMYSDNTIRPRFNFPHSNLEQEYRVLEESSANPITKEENERYKFMLDLFKKILAAENEENDEKLFDLWMEAKNNEFLVHSVEYRLGKNLNNIKLWKLYIQFLKEQKSKKDLLNLYSKYCRYFLDDDDEIKEEYKNSVACSAKSEFHNEIVQEQEKTWTFSKGKMMNYFCVNWKNAFEFEKCKPSKMPEFPVLIDQGGKRPVQHEGEIAKPNFEKYHNQIFPFSKPIMDYLIQNRSPQLLHKFHKCCKNFFAILPFPICHQFCGGGSAYKHQEIPVTFYGHSVTVSDPEPMIKFDRRLIISNSFNVYGKNPTLMPYVLENVFSCEAKYVHIVNKDLTLKDLKFLFKNGKTRHLNFENVKIFDLSGNLAPMEEILKLVPKIVEFRMRNPYITAETSRNMSELKFDNYIKEFKITAVSNNLEPNEFLAFLKKNFKPWFSAVVTFVQRNPTFAEFIYNNYGSDVIENENFYIRIFP